MQTTNKGEMIVVTGSGTGETPNSKGIVKIRDEGDLWTQSARLAVVLPYIGDNIAYQHGLHFCQEVYSYRNQNKV